MSHAVHTHSDYQDTCRAVTMVTGGAVRTGSSFFLITDPATIRRLVTLHWSCDATPMPHPPATCIVDVWVWV